MKITLGKKILAGFVGCALVLLTVAVVSFRNSEKLVDTNQWVNHTYEVLNELEQIKAGAIEAEGATRGFVITGNEDHLTTYQQSLAGVPEHLGKIKELASDNPRQLANIERIEKLAQDHLQHLQACVDARRNDFEKARQMILTGESRRLLNAVRTSITQAKSLEQKLLADRKQTSDEDTRNFNILFILLMLVIVTVLVAVYIIITTNLKALKKAEAMAADKNWTLAGTGELVRSIQGNKGVTEISRVIIQRLAEYTDASLGALYITEDDNTTLKLRATYAIDKKETERLFTRQGEGLAAQAAAGKKIMLQHVPEPHFTLNTSFGELKPREILAMPFLFEDTVVGVIELGTAQTFTEIQKQYLDLVTDSMAIAIVSAKGREKTTELLEETQRQGEELEVQQEELRQANEELMTKTDQLENTASELRSQQEELYETNQRLEEQAGVLSQQKERLEIAKQEIETKAAEIEITSKYKSEFLANMSHELRTPLNSVLILAQLLSENKSGKLGDKELEFARNIHNSGSDLLNLINEILDLSKIEAGKLQLDIAEVSFENITRDLQAMFSEVARSKSIDFEITLNRQALPPEMVTDSQRVEQILRNLLSNAFKFTGKGGKISVIMDAPPAGMVFRSKGLNDHKNIVAFAVKDTGVGIPENKRDIIFEAFQQADGSTKRKYGGTGLGLSISRELAYALGGEVRLQSEEGKGSTFTLYLPLKFDSAYIHTADKTVELLH